MHAVQIFELVGTEPPIYTVFGCAGFIFGPTIFQNFSEAGRDEGFSVSLNIPLRFLVILICSDDSSLYSELNM